MCFYVESLIFDGDVSQPVSVKNGVMRVNIGSTAYTVNGFIVQIVFNATSILKEYPATVRWCHNKKHYRTRERTRGNVSMITITDVNDGDVFTCIADNTISSQRKNQDYFCTQPFLHMSIIAS